MARSGRDAVRDYLPVLREKLTPDVVIANGENSAHGSGHTPRICEDLYGYGVHVITSGNHIWGQREIIPYLDRDPKFARPINFPKGAPGKGFVIHEVSGGRKILVINALGRVFMDALDDPFAVVKELVDRSPMGLNGYNAIFLDFHAEASSEKQAIARYFDGKISACIGTHTHVPTADTMILPKGTAFQTDAGMTADYNSIMGRSAEASIHRFTRKIPGMPMIPTEGPGALCGTLIVTDDETGLAKEIHPVRIGVGVPNTI